MHHEHLEAILAHELAHVRRRDNLAAALHMLVETIFWFHPLVWWLGARLVEEREHACDEDVLALGGRRQVYAESILKTCEFCVEAPLACVSGVTGADLKQRITRIMTQRLAEKLSFSRKVLLAAIAAVAIAAPVVLGLLHAPRVQAQSPQTAAPLPHSFEVASIKPNHSADGLFRAANTPDGLTVQGMPVKILITFAYNVKDFQISGGPAWIDSERYDIEAKLDDATAQALKKLPLDQMMEQRRIMLRSLLADRFKLKVTESSKELPIYALVVAKNGPKLTQSTAGSVPEGRRLVTFGLGELSGTGTMKLLAEQISLRVDREVVDKTGLQGTYDFTLHFAPERPMPMPGAPGDSGPGGAAPPPDSSAPSFFTALQEQLGLKLEPQKGPVKILVIDSVERPSEN